MAGTVAYCDPDRAEDLSAQQKAAVVTSWLQAGRELTTNEIGAALGLGQSGAWHLIDGLSMVLPITKGPDKRWRWVGGDG